jgi:hypothetical protein
MPVSGVNEFVGLRVMGCWHGQWGGCPGTTWTGSRSRRAPCPRPSSGRRDGPPPRHAEVESSVGVGVGVGVGVTVGVGVARESHRGGPTSPSRDPPGPPPVPNGPGRGEREGCALAWRGELVEDGAKGVHDGEVVAFRCRPSERGDTRPLTPSLSRRAGEGGVARENCILRGRCRAPRNSTSETASVERGL